MEIITDELIENVRTLLLLLQEAQKTNSKKDFWVKVSQAEQLIAEIGDELDSLEPLWK